MAKAGRKKKEEITEEEKVIEQKIIELEENKAEVTQEEIEAIPELKEDKVVPVVVANFANVNESEETKALNELEIILEEKQEMPEVDCTNLTTMSEQAIKWEKYIAMYKFTPERFLERYPNHPNKRFIEEIISFKKS